MANPRKFSEKIALHTQKQAEGTAAFEAILREVSATTRAATVKVQQDQQQQQQQQQQQRQQQSHLTQPSVCVYRGRSLPNVNQMVSPVRLSSNSIDLQSALSSLENMKQQALSGQCLSERQVRERTLPTHRKNSPLDRHIHRDCSPYGSVYLSPPPDGSWRRASSDSALHSSVIATPTQPPPPQCGSGLMLNTDQSENVTVQLTGGGDSSSAGSECTGMIWDQNKSALRPRSCDVPGINIFPSPEQVSSAVQVHITNSTGSLPNLTTVNFSSPLALPLDGNAAQGQQGSSQGGTGTCCTSQMNKAVRIRPQQGMVPVLSSRMHRHMIPAPLVLHSSNYIMTGSSMAGEGITASNIGGTCLLSPISPAALQSPLFTSDSTGLLSSMTAIPPQTPTGFYIQSASGGGVQMRFGDEYLQQQQVTMSPHQLTPTVASPHQLSPTNILSPQLTQILVPQCQIGSSQDNASQSHLSHHLLQDHFMVPAVPHLQLAQGDSTASQKMMQESKGECMSSVAPQQLIKAAPQFVQANSSPRFVQANMVPQLFQANLTAQQMLQANLSLQQHISSSIANKAPAQQQQQQPQIVTANILPQQTVCSNASSSIEDSLDLNQQAQANVLQQRFQQFTMVHEDGLGAGDNNPLKDVRLQQLPFGSTNFLLMQSGSGSSSSSTALLGQWMAAQQQHQQQQQASLSAQQSQLEQMSTGSRFVSSSQQSDCAQFVTVTQAGLTSTMIPDIVLSAEDLSIYCGHSLSDDSKNLGMIEAMCQSDDLKDNLNTLTYLGDSFDGEVFTAEDALRLGLDPLELEELQMLADPSIITDSATEDSFRLDQP